MGEPRLKRNHKYYTQMEGQTWPTGYDYFVAWTQGHKPLYGRVEFDGYFSASVVINIYLINQARRPYIYVIDRARGPYGRILLKFTFYVVIDRAASARSINT